MTEGSEVTSPLEFLAYRLPSKLEPGLREQRSRSLLLRVLEQKTTIAFLGAGVSQPFGYPTWKGLGLAVLSQTLMTLKKLDNTDSRVRGCIDYLTFLKQGIRKLGKNPDAPALMFMIGACKRSLQLAGGDLVDSVYYSQFGQRFAAPQYPENANVLTALLDLPVFRFVTTNYDWEIEKALAKDKKRAVSEADFGRGVKASSEKFRGRLSITQRREDLDRLALFALGRAGGNDNMVFHCHGRFDDPELIVATEADYQHWYLSNDEDASTAFQQNIELLLQSNPLLFIGYSLRDDDLLRPLRQLGLLDPARRDTRPLFALLECSQRNPERDLYNYDVLFERYGLHVIPYRREGDQTESLRAALQELGKDLGEAHQKWSEKPFLKRPSGLAKLPARYCEIQTPTAVPVKPLASLMEEIRQPGVVVLLGPSGSGKSHYALKLSEEGGFSGVYYWNAHYGNEAITALDHALAYFDPERTIKGTRHQRIRRCLREQRFLLILDGCERLLRKTENQGEGTTYSITFRRLLEIFTDPNNLSTVVLATRLWPVELDSLRRQEDGRQIVRCLKLSRIEADDLAEIGPFANLLAEGRDQARREISALCSLLRGHNYGLFLAETYLDACKDDPFAALQFLNRSLADRHRDERLQVMVDLQVQRVDAKQDGKSARALLERLTLFLGPVTRKTIEICFKDVCAGTILSCDCLREELIAAGLLFRMHPPGSRSEGEPETYTVHCTARTALLRSQRSAPTDPLPAFGLSGCTCGRLGVNPDRAREPQIRKVFERIIESAEWLLKTEAGTAVSKDNFNQAQAYCRDAFSLVRSCMEANTAPRWCTYDEYLQFPLAVATLAKQIARAAPTLACWTYCEHPDAYELAERENATLYSAELAWLYNDIALALSGSGSIHDSCALWEQAYEISRLIEHPKEGGGFHLEVLLSLTYTFVEMGRLSAAARQLDDAERLLRSFPDDDFAARILGLRGLMLHLRGDLQGADDLYDRCLKLLRPGVNLRAQSIFLKHKADVKITTLELDEADLLIRNSRALAESGVFPELVANARISEGHRLTRKGEAVKARLEYTAVLREARRIGFRKLEVRALTALARLALDQKDADGARDLAMRALILANEFGLGLRQSHALVVLGLATLEMGKSELGIAYLRTAKVLADDQEYWSRSREAENKLLELGVNPARESEVRGGGL